MSYRDWVSYAALGGLILVYPVDDHCRAQERPAETQEQPKTETKPLDLTPLQDRIESVTRAIESLKDNPDAAAEKERGDSDLRAQWEMAKWAKWLFGTTVATIILTMAGLFLIWRTLVHTKHAAVAAKEMVEEAKRTTKAAEDAVVETRRIGEAQVRAHLSIENPGIAARTETNCLQVSFVVRNYGNTVAKDFCFTCLVTLRRVPLPGEPPRPPYVRHNAPQYPNFPGMDGRRISAQGTDSISHLLTDFPFTEEEIEFLREGSLWVDIGIATRFRDVFDIEISDIQHYHRLGGVPLDTRVEIKPFGAGIHPMSGIPLPGRAP